VSGPEREPGLQNNRPASRFSSTKWTVQAANLRRIRGLALGFKREGGRAKDEFRMRFGYLRRRRNSRRCIQLGRRDHFVFNRGRGNLASLDFALEAFRRIHAF